MKRRIYKEKTQDISKIWKTIHINKKKNRTSSFIEKKKKKETNDIKKTKERKHYQQ